LHDLAVRRALEATTTTDESSAAHGTTTAAGGVLDNTQFQFGSSSMSNGEMTLPSSADWALGTSNFTIECWIRPSSLTGTHHILAQCFSGFGWLFFLNSNAISFNVSTTGSDNIGVPAAGGIVVNNWAAVCVDFDGTKYRLYINGTMASSSTRLHTIFNPSVASGIGGSSTGVDKFSGWIDELRLTKGVARYASDGGYTPATSVFPRS
jgi:hypothetical protein